MCQLVTAAATVSVLANSKWVVSLIFTVSFEKVAYKDTTQHYWSPLSCIIALPFPHNPISFAADVSNADDPIYSLSSLMYSTAPYAVSW